MNRLYYGDCLSVMQEMEADSVDLIYLDPPFNSKKDYHMIYKSETGRPLPIQREAFRDSWTLDLPRERAIRLMPVLMREAGIDDDAAEFWRVWANALRKTQPSLLAYLSYMAERLVSMRGILKSTGSIYLHCDPTASHYLKVMMDVIFGHRNFRREIIWANEDQSGFKSKARNWIRGSDTIFYYTKSSKCTFNKEYKPLDEKTIRRYDKIDDNGRRYKIYRDKKTGKERRSYLKAERGVSVPSVWADIPSFQTVNNTGEYLGYPTQKPLALLKRIIQASSNAGDLVLDPFCGCATTVEAAHKLGRKWIGIDISIHAIKRVAKIRLEERLKLKEDKDFIIQGVPQDLEGAKDLWTRDKYHFQTWCVDQMEGVVTGKKSADGGIDGRVYFDIPGERELGSMIIEVKGGRNVGIADLRALHSVIERDDAKMGGLIVMEKLGAQQSKNFQQLMAEAGDIQISSKQYPRLQMLTVSEILDGRRFDMPHPQGWKKSQNELF